MVVRREGFQARCHSVRTSAGSNSRLARHYQKWGWSGLRSISPTATPVWQYISPQGWSFTLWWRRSRGGSPLSMLLWEQEGVWFVDERGGAKISWRWSGNIILFNNYPIVTEPNHSAATAQGCNTTTHKIWTWHRAEEDEKNKREKRVLQ